jgi:hypothetical protein
MSRTFPRSALMLSLLSMAACREEPSAPAPAARVTAPRRRELRESPPAATEPRADAPSPAAFREGPTVRDPFRVMAPTVVVPPSIADDDSPLHDVPLDELRLLAVVASADGPIAMVSDASGWGTTLRRGMRVGRPEIVRDRDVDYSVRWRVARIDPSHLSRGADGRLSESGAEVVFEQDDPTGRHLPRERSLTLAPAERTAMRGTFRLASAATY